MVYAEVRQFQKLGILPGISSGKWEGYILVQPVEGVPALLDFSHEII